MLRIFLAIFAVLAVSCANAGEVPTSEIKYIAPWTTLVDVEMDTPGVDPDNCGNSSLYRLDLQNDPGAQAKLATLLSAFAAGKSVGLHIQGCLGGYPKILAVRLYR